MAHRGTIRLEGGTRRFVEVCLHAQRAAAGERCFIADSVDFPVRHEPRIIAARDD